MRVSTRASVGVQALRVTLWLALGTAAWFLSVDRASHEAKMLYPIFLAGSALALLIAAWLRRMGLARRIDAFELKAPGGLPAAGETLAFTVRVTSFGKVPVRLVAATLSAVEEPASPGELPTVIARTEAVLAERVQLKQEEPLDLTGSLVLPDSGPAARVQLDAVLFIGTRPARRATVVLRKPAAAGKA